jgi:hypothetical protein
MLAQNPTRKCNQPIAYASCLLNITKRNYTTMECEALTMVYTLHRFRHYLLGNKFVFCVDHMVPLYLIKKPQVFGHIAQWFILFLEYNFLVVYKLGKSHYLTMLCHNFQIPKKGSTWPNFRCYPFHIITYLVVRCAWLPINQDLFGSFIIGAKKEISSKSFSFHIISWCFLSTRSWSSFEALFTPKRNFGNHSKNA